MDTSVLIRKEMKHKCFLLHTNLKKVSLFTVSEAKSLNGNAHLPKGLDIFAPFSALLPTFLFLVKGFSCFLQFPSLLT